MQTENQVNKITKIKNNLKWLVKPPVKFYSDYTPLERAWWGLWRKPQNLLTMSQVLELNKDIIEEIVKSSKISKSNHSHKEI